MKNEERLKIGNKVSNITIVVNIILSFIKNTIWNHRT